MCGIFNEFAPDEMELLEDEPDAEDFAFAERAEQDKQDVFDGSRGVGI